MMYFCAHLYTVLRLLLYSWIYSVAAESPLTVEIIEEAPVGTLIHGVTEYLNQLKLSQAGPDRKDIKYQLLGDDDISRLLQLHPQLGQLRVSARIDREVICPVEVNEDAPHLFQDNGSLGRTVDAPLRVRSPYSLELPSIEECIHPINILMITQSKDDNSASTSEPVVQTTRIKLNLIIRDINDNAPSWPFHSVLQISFVETPSLGTDWPTLGRHSHIPITLDESGSKYAKTIERAVDPDVGINGTLVYRLIGPGAEYFRLDDSNSYGGNGRVESHRLDMMDGSPIVTNLDYSGLKLNQPPLRIWPVVSLDRETEEYTGRHGVFNLTLLANDLGVPSKTGSISLVIFVTDVNDNPPIFQNDMYGPGLGETSLPAAERRLVIYRPSSGHIRETMPLGGFVVQLNATDKDEGTHAEITYEFCPCDRNIALKYFDIDRHTGRITIASKLDYDSGPRRFLFKVIAKDGAPEPYRLTGTAAVEVMVADENDETPEIRVMLVESTKGSGTTADLSSSQANSDPAANPNQIGPHGARYLGEFTTAINENPRPETVVAYIQVFDRDHHGKDQVYCRLGPSDNFTLQIDSVEHTGQSTSQSMYAASEPLATIAQRQDFRLVTGAEMAHLHDAYEPLDRESTPVQRVTLTCTDSVGNAAFVQIKVHLNDVNDNAPQFVKNGHFVFQLPENQELIGDKPVWLGRVAANDQDEGENAAITYRIGEESTWSENNKLHVEGGVDRLFELDPQTGDLFAKSSFDRESAPQDGLYRLRVYAMDKGLPRMTGTAKVDVYILDVNDWAPQFSKDVYTFSVSEDARVQDVVGVVEAVDRDANSLGRITYQLVTHYNTQHAVNHRVQRTLSELRESIKNAKGGSESPVIFERSKRSAAKLVSNLEHAQIQLNINSVPSSAEIPVNALTEANQAVQGAIQNGLDHFGPPQHHFSVDRLSGKIRLIRRLDRESTPFYTLEILATDTPPLALPVSKHLSIGLYGNRTSSVQMIQKSLSATTRVVIAVADVNDNSPVFRNPNTSTSIQLRLQETLGRQLLVVEATDADEGDNGRVSYFIRSEIPRPPGGPGTGYFAVDDASGILFLARVLNSTLAHRLIIDACDNGVASARRCTPSPSIRITVLDTLADQDNAELTLYQARSFSPSGQIDLLPFDLDTLASRSAVMQTGRRNEVVVVCLVVIFSVLLLATIMLVFCLVRRRGQSQNCIYRRPICIDPNENSMDKTKSKRPNTERSINDSWLQEGLQDEQNEEAQGPKFEACKIPHCIANGSQNEANYHVREHLLAGMVCPMSTGVYSPSPQSIHAASGPFDQATPAQCRNNRRIVLNDHQLSFPQTLPNAHNCGIIHKGQPNYNMNPLLAQSTYQTPSPDYQSLDTQWHHFPVEEVAQMSHVQLYRNPLNTRGAQFSYSVPQRDLPEKPAESKSDAFITDLADDIRPTSVPHMYYEISEAKDAWKSPKPRPPVREQHEEGTSNMNYNRVATLGRQSNRKSRPQGKQKGDSMFHLTAGELALHSGKKVENVSEIVCGAEEHMQGKDTDQDMKRTGNYTYQTYREGTFV